MDLFHLPAPDPSSQRPRPYRAPRAFGVPIVPLGGLTSVSAQASGAPPARRPPGRRAAPSPARTPIFSSSICCITKAAPPQKSDGSAIHPYHLFSIGATAPLARSARPRRSQMVGSARRSGPKPQARLRLVDLLVGEKRRLPHGRRSFQVRCVVSQRRLRRKSRTARRSIPTCDFRNALLRRWESAESIAGKTPGSTGSTRAGL